VKLVLLREWVEDAFGEPRPTTQTIRNQIRIGEWPAHAARKVGGRYFIDVDKVDATAADGDWLLDATA